jgi:hypothetical protein
VQRELDKAIIGHRNNGLGAAIVDKALAMNKALLAACLALTIGGASAESRAAGDTAGTCDLDVAPAGPMSPLLGVTATFIGLVRITSSCSERVVADLSFAIYRHGSAKTAEGFEFSPTYPSLVLPAGKVQKELPFSLIAKSGAPGRYDVHVIVRAAGQGKRAVFNDVAM